MTNYGGLIRTIQLYFSSKTSFSDVKFVTEFPKGKKSQPLARPTVSIGIESITDKKVDGVYDKDPKNNEDAKMYNEITFREALNKNLRVMDMTAFAMANDNDMPIRVFNMNKMGNITKAISGESIGTYVHN